MSKHGKHKNHQSTNIIEQGLENNLAQQSYTENGAKLGALILGYLGFMYAVADATSYLTYPKSLEVDFAIAGGRLTEAIVIHLLSAATGIGIFSLVGGIAGGIIGKLIDISTSDDNYKKSNQASHQVGLFSNKNAGKHLQCNNTHTPQLRAAS